MQVLVEYPKWPKMKDEVLGIMSIDNRILRKTGKEINNMLTLTIGVTY